MKSEPVHNPASAPHSAQFLAAYHALKTFAGWRPLDDRLLIRVIGDDRVSFLHGMCTAGVKKLTAGQVAPALFVTERAHLIAEFFIYTRADSFLLEVERSAWPRINAHLEKFLVADDVEFEALEDLRLLAVEGPEAAAALTSHSLALPELWRMAAHDQVQLAAFPRLGVPSCTLIADTAAAARLCTNFSTALPELTAGALEAVRIENGLARLGVDTGDKTLALEARLEPAISLTKGCYIGQETLERATARGAIKRRLCGLRLSAPVAAGAPITLDGRPIGTLSSSADSPEFGPIGLAILHHSAWPNQPNEVAPTEHANEPRRVTIGAGAEAVMAAVAELPFSLR